MTEAEWLGSSRPLALLTHVMARVTARKLWCFALGAFPFDAHRPFFAAAVRHAEGDRQDVVARYLADFRMTEIEAAWVNVRNIARRAPVTSERLGLRLLSRAAARLTSPYPAGAVQAAIVRDLFGNPFRPVKFARAWRTETAVGVAQAMYDARDFAAMPILADALQDAGCEDEQVLAHCRGGGPQVRGCWVVDGVLGKG